MNINKKVITLILCSMIFTDFCYASNPVSTIREELGLTLNKTVRELKVYFAKINSSLKGLTEEVIDLDKKAKKLEEESRTAESNPTLLDQATKRMRWCDYKTQDLRWSNTLGWFCRSTHYPVDCNPIPGYEKDDVLGKPYGGYECNYKGGYMVQKNKWNACDNHIGEQHEQWSCLIDNQKADQKYEVSKSKCDDLEKPSLLRQPCGPNGGRSSCRCLNGYVYKYIPSVGGRCVKNACRNGHMVNGSCKVQAGIYSRPGWVSGYTTRSFSKHFPNPPYTIEVHAWTEDIIYNIRYVSDSGRTIYSKAGKFWYENNYGTVARFDDTFSVNQAGTLYFSVTEEGPGGSPDLGYRVEYYEKLKNYCSDGEEYIPSVQKCAIPVSVCKLEE